MDLAVADRIFHMRATFDDLVDLGRFYAICFEELLCSAGRHDLEADADQFAHGTKHAFLVFVTNRHENRAFAWQFNACTELRLGEGKRVVVIKAHDFAS